MLETRQGCLLPEASCLGLPFWDFLESLSPLALFSFFARPLLQLSLEGLLSLVLLSLFALFFKPLLQCLLLLADLIGLGSLLLLLSRGSLASQKSLLMRFLCLQVGSLDLLLKHTPSLA